MNLKRGDKGENVKKLQRALQRAGFDLREDGDFRGITEGAVKAFQEREGLKLDGIAGKATLTALGLDPSTLEEQEFILGPVIKATTDGVMAAIGTTARIIGDVGEAAIAASTNPVTSLRIWFKAFIPQAKVTAPPGYDCFLGDNRSFSSDRDASARMHSEVFLRDLHTANPTMEQTHTCGTTVQVNCDSGQVVLTDTASTDGMKFYNFRFAGAEVYNWDAPYAPAANPGTIIVPATAPVSVDYVGAATNPLVPVAPLIDLQAHIELDLPTGLLTVTGAVDDFPAFEGYFLVNEQEQADRLFIHDAANTPVSLTGGPTRSFSQTVNVRSYMAQG